MTTWNPADKHVGLTLSNGDLTAAKTSLDATWSAVRSTDYHFAGRWYFEVTLDAGIVGGYPCVGVGTASMALNNYPGAGTHGSSMHMANGVYNYNTGTTFQTYGLHPGGLPFTNGRTIGCEVNGNEMNMRFVEGLNAPFDESYYTTSLTFSSSMINYIGYYAVVSLHKVGESATVNFGASDFKLTRLPHGVRSWDGNQSWEDWSTTVDDFAELLEPPKPPGPSVRLTNPDGTPTKAYHDFLTKRYEYDRAVRTLLQEG